MQITDPTTSGTGAAQLGRNDTAPNPSRSPEIPRPKIPAPCTGHIPTAPHAAPSMTRTQVRAALGFTWGENAANAAFGSDA